MACETFRPYRFRTVSYGTNGRFRRMVEFNGGLLRIVPPADPLLQCPPPPPPPQNLA